MSSSTTKKFREFMAEPLGEKGIRDVPGIGDVLGGKLSEAGYEKAYTLFGKYLLCNKDLEEFQDWMQTQCGANSHQAKTTAQALSEWAEASVLMASSTSQKFRDFTGEPLKDKELHEVPGLGPKLASHLETAGITKAFELLGVYLTLLKNKEYFELWIRDNAGANRHQAKECADAIDAFCSQFL